MIETLNYLRDKNIKCNSVSNENETEIYQSRSTLKYNIMKLYVLIPFYLLHYRFSQHERKEHLPFR
jgi:hypothetical protein